jgi:hypothetical protein
LKLRNWNVGNNASAILTARHDDVMTVLGRSFSMILATASGVVRIRLDDQERARRMPAGRTDIAAISKARFRAFHVNGGRRQS